MLDGGEVKQIIDGETLAADAAQAAGKDAEDHTQQVLRPEGGRRVPGLLGRGASAAGVIPRVPGLPVRSRRHLAGLRRRISAAQSSRCCRATDCHAGDLRIPAEASSACI